jgi:Glycosyltransferase family 10 (fucosyltransferase) C-term
MRLLLRLSNILPHGDKLNAQMTGSNLVLKRDAIARFMFNMAFENSIEDGYVTEKPFDALLAGDR